MSGTWALLLVVLVALIACSSQPSTKTIAEDFVESIRGLTPAQQRCMLEKIGRYDEDELNRLGEDNEHINFNRPDAMDSATPAFKRFVADLRVCVTSSDSTATTEP